MRFSKSYRVKQKPFHRVSDSCGELRGCFRIPQQLQQLGRGVPASLYLVTPHHRGAGRSPLIADRRRKAEERRRDGVSGRRRFRGLSEGSSRGTPHWLRIRHCGRLRPRLTTC